MNENELILVENPGKRKRKRKMSAKQKKYFGKRRKTTRRRRRSNPSLSTYVAANPRRRKGRGVKRRRNTYVASRNPSGLMGYFNIKSALSVAGGIITARYGTRIIGMVWPGVPSTGLIGTAVKVGTVVVAAAGLKMLTKNNQVAYSFAAGGIGYCLYELAEQYLLPMIGMSGVGAYTQGEQYLSYDEANDLSGVGGDYSIMQPGVGTPPGITDQVLAA